jgi:hypothetical protein
MPGWCPGLTMVHLHRGSGSGGGRAVETRITGAGRDTVEHRLG